MLEIDDEQIDVAYEESSILQQPKQIPRTSSEIKMKSIEQAQMENEALAIRPVKMTGSL
jgi:hypothetical protein